MGSALMYKYKIAEHDYFNFLYVNITEIVESSFILDESII